MRKLFADTFGEGFGGNCDKACFAGRGGFDRLRGVVCDLIVDLLEGFGADLKCLEENFLKRSLSVIGGNTFGVDTLNKDAEVRDLSGA